LGRLSATSVKANKVPGRYGDGDGLFLLIGPSGSKSWVVRVQKDGRRRDFGLGSEKKLSLAMARKLAAELRGQVHLGIDPIAERRKREGIPTFRVAAAKVFAEQQKGWRNAKHRGQWLSTLEA
jgi:Arm DNA-binding domain